MEEWKSGRMGRQSKDGIMEYWNNGKAKEGRNGQWNTGRMEEWNDRTIGIMEDPGILLPN